MSECFKCGISDKKTNLVTAISREGVVKVCGRCAFGEGMPIIHKKNFSPEKSNDEFIAETHPKGKTVYNRLSKMSGVLADKGRIGEPGKSAREREERLNMQNKELRKLVEKEPEKKIVLQKRTDLADNFHWLIMRARRAKKITQKDLAKALGEPEKSIKEAEEGKIAIGDDKLVDKIENYLNIRLRKALTRETVSNFGREGNYSPMAARTVAISETRTLSEDKRKEVVEGSDRVLKGRREMEDKRIADRKREAEEQKRDVEKKKEVPAEGDDDEDDILSELEKPLSKDELKRIMEEDEEY